jgi:hypothetical protein
VAAFVNGAAEHVDARDAAAERLGGHRRGRVGHRDLEIDAAVRPAGVVVIDIPVENTLQMLPVTDQCPI